LKNLYLVLAALVGTLCLAGCGTTARSAKVLDPPERAAEARILAETAARVAVSKVGAKVCRQMMVGISEYDWVRGVVTEVEGEMIRVRIDEPGRFPEIIAGTAVTPGALISDTPLNWRPCV